MMDIMDIRIIWVRAFRKKCLQVFILFIFLGCISALNIMVADTIKDLSDF
ncbi:hypothetical protein [Pectinatus haikarae]|uniref:ABC transporter permease n=1 Tax=Pectinatus haikarae TaxID=349096 RepID=A0ABT9Y7E9_9FIRM|nr:hypothetical protein [Pectinatus haikarae]MDQ0203753.1 hypothetical protein [Pectinatus haikarae]